MKSARTLAWTLRLLSAAVPVMAGVTAATTLVACDDENDPKTWVKRLDDPAQRSKAIERLKSFYEDGMTKAGNDAGAPEIKSLLDTIVDPLTKQYTAGNLDEKTRKDLMELLAETHDARTQPALTKALKDFEMGKTDDEVRSACTSVIAMSKAGTKLDQALVDELWNVFSKFQVSKAQSERLYRAVHDSILQVKDPSYGDKAIDKLKAVVPKDPSVDVQKDQIQWWQATSVQILSELRYTKAIKQLIITMLTPTKVDLAAPVQFALVKMGKDAEPELVKALSGSDPDYAALEKNPDDKEHMATAIVAKVIAAVGRPAGRDAILALLPNADTDTLRTELVQALVQLPNDPRSEPAFLDTYNKKLTWDSSDALLGAIKPRIALAQASADFYDPKLADWLLKEMKGAPDYSARMVQLGTEAKLMTPDNKDDVAKGLAALKKESPADGFAQVQGIFDAMAAALDKCKMDNACYLSVLDEPIPTAPPTAYNKQVKATWMIVMNAGTAADAMRGELLKRVDKVKNTGARIAICEAIDELAPKGDSAAADALDKIVADDTKAGDKNLIATDNTVALVAWRLRVRGQ